MITTRIAIVLAALCATASAQPAPPTTPADVAYQEGRRLYDLREFADAIVKFKEAYRLRNDAASLFNIAQSYRLLGDCPNAHGYYKTFQRNYPDERADAVAKFIAELEPCSKPVQPVQPTPPIQPTQPVQPTLQHPPPPEPYTPPESARVLERIGLAVGGLGVATLATGLVFGLRARSLSKDLDQSETWDAGLDASAHRSDRTAKIFFGVGGVIVLGGAIVYYLGHRAREPPSSSGRFSVIPSTTGATLVWSLRLE